MLEPISLQFGPCREMNDGKPMRMPLATGTWSLSPPAEKHQLVPTPFEKY
jgi:hypothetical protein